MGPSGCGCGGSTTSQTARTRYGHQATHNSLGKRPPRVYDRAQCRRNNCLTFLGTSAYSPKLVLYHILLTLSREKDQGKNVLHNINTGDTQVKPAMRVG